MRRRIAAEFKAAGLHNFPIASRIDAMVRRERRRNRCIGFCVFLAGIIIGGGGALWVIWNQLDAMRGSNEKMAASCLNPTAGKGTTKAQAQIIVDKIQHQREAQ